MTKPIVLVEGHDEAQLLELLLAQAGPPRVQILYAGGHSVLLSMARSLLATRSSPLAIISDSGTKDSREVSEQERVAYDILKPAALSAPFRLFLAQPDLKATVTARGMTYPIASSTPTQAVVKAVAKDPLFVSLLRLLRAPATWKPAT